jgi:hypothetical protein
MSDRGPKPTPEPTSEVEFARARRAVELGWASAEDVEAALVAEDEAGPARRLGVAARLRLNDGQRLALERPSGGVSLPREVADALRDREKTVAHFVIVGPLGSGGMGEVARAFDLKLGRFVALKLLHRFHDERSRAYFEREARLAASLALPDIATIYEVGEHDGRPYIAMQLISGRTLAHLAADGAVDVRRAAELVRDAARAVDRAHKQGVVHRDLKPGNLMVDASGRVVVLDFGLARPAEDVAGLGSSENPSTLAGTGFIVGTPEYMAPEQARGTRGGTDARTDVYALGACLFALVAGRPPFQSEDRGEVIAQVLRDPPPRPRALAPKVPDALEAVVLRCLEKEPARRYQTAAALADDLDRLLTFSESDATAVASRPAPSGPPTARTRGIRGAATAAIVLVGIGLAVAWHLRDGRDGGAGEEGREAAPVAAGARGPVLVSRDPTFRGVSHALATDGERLYVSGVRDGKHTLASMPVTGAAFEPISMPGLTPAGSGIALLGDDLYWIDANSGAGTTTQICAGPKRGGAGPVVYEGKAGVDEPILDGCGLASDGSCLYAVDQIGGLVTRLDPRAGGRPVRISFPLYPVAWETSHMNGVAVAEGTVFVASEAHPRVGPAQVFALAATGGAARVLHTGPPLASPRSLAFRKGVLYIADTEARAVFALPATGAGGPPTVLASGPSVARPTGIAISGDALYITDSGPDAVSVYRIDLAP